MIHFSQHFLHTLSQFHYSLECQSANMFADTFRSTMKTQRRRTGSCCRHTGALSATVVTQPFSQDRSKDIIFVILLVSLKNTGIICYNMKVQKI